MFAASSIPVGNNVSVLVHYSHITIIILYTFISIFSGFT